MDKQERIDKAVLDLGGEWPEEKFRLKTGDYYSDGRGDLRFMEPGAAIYICTHSEFMEARKRLENKPTEWPEGAKILVYDQQGSRWIFGTYVDAHPLEDYWVGHGDSGDYWMDNESQKGTFFGNWRQSLERRPESKSEPEWVPEGIDYHALEEQSQAWGKVWDELIGLVPDMGGLSSTGENCALEAIRLLAKEAGRKTHKERVIDAAMAVAAPRGRDGYKDAYGLLYDAGMLTLPEDSQ